MSDPRTNERIRVPEVRLVGPAGEQVGVVRIEDAIRLAQEADLDLVEVAPNSKPPVAKIMDFGKFKYETAQKAKEARRNQANTILKEVRFRLKIDVHDYETKRKRAEGFLKAGDKVKAMILFRGREQSRPEQGVRLLQRFAEDVAEFGSVESTPMIDGRNMVMVIGPAKNKSDAKAEAEAKRAASKPARAERPTEMPAGYVAMTAPLASARLTAPISESVSIPDATGAATVTAAAPSVVDAPATAAPVRSAAPKAAASPASSIAAKSAAAAKAPAASSTSTSGAASTAVKPAVAKTATAKAPVVSAAPSASPPAAASSPAAKPAVSTTTPAIPGAAPKPSGAPKPMAGKPRPMPTPKAPTLTPPVEAEAPKTAPKAAAPAAAEAAKTVAPAEADAN
ncbi:MAG: translation initiation factor IF-3 [Microbacteriaceae bacterium]|nr:translation initiation factor IF-3 [Microbacteriaceae bacterium]